MNARQIKLALTAGLINRNHTENALLAVKEVMKTFAEDAGRFLGLASLGKAQINRDVVKETFKLQYEHLTINIDLISNLKAKIETVQRFQLI